MKHCIAVNKAELEALEVGETQVVKAHLPATNVQKGDAVILGEAVDVPLDLGDQVEYTVHRAHAGTGKNGIQPEWVVLELRRHDLMLEGRRPPARSKARNKKP